MDSQGDNRKAGDSDSEGQRRRRGRGEERVAKRKVDWILGRPSVRSGSARGITCALRRTRLTTGDANTIATRLQPRPQLRAEEQQPCPRPPPRPRPQATGEGAVQPTTSAGRALLHSTLERTRGRGASVATRPHTGFRIAGLHRVAPARANALCVARGACAQRAKAR
ncbi:hypothetical protein J1614_009526 [Plenodomus biglobosus]|nr:hypothetical protein J1614_009526 [Plenodomus biglobosus]